MMEKETAVQWLWNCMPTKLLEQDYIKAIFNQAETIEKEQMKKVWFDFDGQKPFEEYYNETFENK